jgi:DNA-directed RNA polymerase subunit RPC12/RpoP
MHNTHKKDEKHNHNACPRCGRRRLKQKDDMTCEERKTKINTKMEICDGIDLEIEISPLPDVNAEIFERYVDTVLVPAVEANRQLPGCDKTNYFVLRQLFGSHVESNVREVSTACGSCSHVPASYVTYISSSGRIIIRPCQAIQKISNM